MNFLTNGYCEVSQQIRDRISAGKLTLPDWMNRERTDSGSFVFSGLESRVQPSSFEPVVGNHLFVLDSMGKGIFRPSSGETVRRLLLQMPRGRRLLQDIANGYELKTGYSYLIPLEEKVIIGEEEIIVSSPKSSRGRLFIGTRLLADYSNSFDKIRYDSSYAEIPRELWVLVQPSSINVIVRPGISFSQLRFFSGSAKISDVELKERIERGEIIKQDGKSQQIIDDGLTLHLDLTGEHTEGVVGLRVKNNPHPIDLREKNYEAIDYFEPVLARKGEVLEPRGNYLFASQEILLTPSDLSAQLDRHSSEIHCSFHEAGFVDNGFCGNMVFEVTSHENHPMRLRDRMPMSKLIFFRTELLPDKIYGEEINSNYQGQKGIRLANNFAAYDYTAASKKFRKLNRDVLTQGASLLLRHRSGGVGFEFIRVAQPLMQDISDGFFHSRYDCEEDELILQPIPYVVIFNPENKVFTYRRAKNMEDYGDARLFGKLSIGVGGHIIPSDGPDFLRGCLEREIKEEVDISGSCSEPTLVGTLMAYDRPVDRVHFGVVYAMRADFVTHRESSLIESRMKTIEEIIGGSVSDASYETWSRMLAPYLPDISRLASA